MNSLDNYEKTFLIDLFESMLEYNPDNRTDLTSVLNHPFFWEKKEASTYFKNSCNQIKKPGNFLSRFNRVNANIAYTFEKIKEEYNLEKESSLEKGYQKNVNENLKLKEALNNDLKFFEFVIDEYPSFIFKLWKNGKKQNSAEHEPNKLKTHGRGMQNQKFDHNKFWSIFYFIFSLLIILFKFVISKIFIFIFKKKSDNEVSSLSTKNMDNDKCAIENQNEHIVKLVGELLHKYSIELFNPNTNTVIFPQNLLTNQKEIKKTI